MIKLKNILLEYTLNKPPYADLLKNPTPQLIASVIKQSRGTFNDYEAWAEAAFMAIKTRLKYAQVSKILGIDALKYVKEFMDTSNKYHKQSINVSYRNLLTSKLKSTNSADTLVDSISIIIGDSQTPYVDRNSFKVQLVDELQEGGKGVGWLRDQVDAYPISLNVKNVVLCIGTNGGYSSKGSAEAGLFTAVRKTFPNAKIYAVQGSWGWSGVSKYSEADVRTYYEDNYQSRGAILIEPPIGDGDPHENKPIYRDIGAAIDAKLN